MSPCLVLPYFNIQDFPRNLELTYRAKLDGRLVQLCQLFFPMGTRELKFNPHICESSTIFTEQSPFPPPSIPNEFRCYCCNTCFGLYPLISRFQLVVHVNKCCGLELYVTQIHRTVWRSMLRADKCILFTLATLQRLITIVSFNFSLFPCVLVCWLEAVLSFLPLPSS